MAGHIDGHTSALLGEGMDLDHALGFHLQVRVFPPQPEMFNTAKTAIRRMGRGCPGSLVRLPEGVTYQDKRGAPAEKIVEHLNLWCFLDQGDEE